MKIITRTLHIKIKGTRKEIAAFNLRLKMITSFTELGIKPGDAMDLVSDTIRKRK